LRCPVDRLSTVGDDEDVKYEDAEDMFEQMVSARGGDIDGQSDSTDESDIWTEEILFSSPLDKIDVYATFAETMHCE